MKTTFRILIILFFYVSPCLFADEPKNLTDELGELMQPKISKIGSTYNIRHENSTYVKKLLDEGADPNGGWHDKSGNISFTFLMGALRSGYTRTAKLLLEYGADPSLKTNDEQTVMHYWLYTADVSLLDKFLSCGFALEEADSQGYTPLMYAAKNYITEDYHAKIRINKAITILLERGADPNRQNDKGETVLHLFIHDLGLDKSFTGQRRVVAAMLKAGASPDIKDNKGVSALSRAITLYSLGSDHLGSTAHNNVKKIMNLLLEYTNENDAAIAELGIAEKRLKKNFKSDILPVIITASVPLVVGGLSIGMREGVYADDKTSNFMGPVFSTITIAAPIILLGSFLDILGNAGYAPGRGFESLFFSPSVIIGLTVGIIVTAASPSVRNAFNNNPVLYYLPTAVTAISAPFVLISIKH